MPDSRKGSSLSREESFLLVPSVEASEPKGAAAER
jgi:hypothetical protein